MSSTAWLTLLLFFMFTHTVISTQKLCSTATWNETGVTIDGINGKNTGLGTYGPPFGIALDSDDNLYVSDGFHKRISKRNKITGKITQVASNLAGVLFVDKYNTLYVSNTTITNVLKLNVANGKWTKAIGSYEVENSDKPLQGLRDIYVDNQLSVYLVDSDNCRVVKYSLGAKIGIIVAGGNGCGTAENQLYIPTGVYVDETDKNTLYIADYYNHRVQKWVHGATKGVTVAGGNGMGRNLNQLNLPSSVLLDPITKAIYIIDSHNSRIVRWLKNAKEGQIILNRNQLYFPFRMKFGSDKSFYVVEPVPGISRIQKFSFNKSSCPT